MKPIEVRPTVPASAVESMVELYAERWNKCGSQADADRLQAEIERAAETLAPEELLAYAAAPSLREKLLSLCIFARAEERAAAPRGSARERVADEHCSPVSEKRRAREPAGAGGSRPTRKEDPGQLATDGTVELPDYVRRGLGVKPGDHVSCVYDSAGGFRLLAAPQLAIAAAEALRVLAGSSEPSRPARLQHAIYLCQILARLLDRRSPTGEDMRVWTVVGALSIDDGVHAALARHEATCREIAASLEVDDG